MGAAVAQNTVAVAFAQNTLVAVSIARFLLFAVLLLSVLLVAVRRGREVVGECLHIAHPSLAQTIH